MQGVQREREETLARKLKEFLTRYVRGDKEGFIYRAESEAKRLSDAGKQLPTLPRCYYSDFPFRFYNLQRGLTTALLESCLQWTNL